MLVGCTVLHGIQWLNNLGPFSDWHTHKLHVNSRTSAKLGLLQNLPASHFSTSRPISCSASGLVVIGKVLSRKKASCAAACSGFSASDFECPLLPTIWPFRPLGGWSLKKECQTFKLNMPSKQWLKSLKLDTVTGSQLLKLVYCMWKYMKVHVYIFGIFLQPAHPPRALQIHHELGDPPLAYCGQVACWTCGLPIDQACTIRLYCPLKYATTRHPAVFKTRNKSPEKAKSLRLTQRWGPISKPFTYHYTVLHTCRPSCNTFSTTQL